MSEIQISDFKNYFCQQTRYEKTFYKTKIQNDLKLM